MFGSLLQILARRSYCTLDVTSLVKSHAGSSGSNKVKQVEHGLRDRYVKLEVIFCPKSASCIVSFQVAVVEVAAPTGGFWRKLLESFRCCGFRAGRMLSLWAKAKGPQAETRRAFESM